MTSKVRESILESGDKVLIRNVGLRGKHKIADKWSKTVYRIVKQIDNSPVYVVAPVDSGSPERTLHRDLLLPCGFLSTCKDGSTSAESKPRMESFSVPQDAPTDKIDDVSDHVPEDYVVEYYSPQSRSWVETIDLPLPSLIEPEGELCSSEEESAELENMCPVQSQERARTSEHEHYAESTLSPEAQPFYPQTTSVLTELTDTLSVGAETDLTVPEELIKGQEKGDEAKADVSKESDTSETEGIPRSSDELVQEHFTPRRSTRQRVPSRKLTYPTLGNPLVLIMQSLFSGLDKAFSQALDYDMSPRVSSLLPHEIV